MELALIIWGGTIATSIVLTVVVCRFIEKSNVKRWGATGRLFKYE